MLGDSKPKARVEHRCGLCNRVIGVGETYHRARIVGDDGPYVFKKCAHCSATLRLYFDEIVWEPSEGYCDEDFHNWEPSTIHGARLRAQYRRKWRRRDGTLYPVPTALAVAS